jgi:hypothetical protein
VRAAWARMCGQHGQALPLVLAVAAVVVAAALGLGAFGALRVASGGARLAADLAALSAGRALLAAIPAAMLDPWDLRRALDRPVRDAASRAARGAGAVLDEVRLLGDGRIPTGVQVRVRRAGPLGVGVSATARAGIAAAAGGADGGPVGWATGGGYSGPLVYRNGKPMCPAVAAAFDQMDRAIRAAGMDLVVVSAFRSDAEQAVLFARHPDPKWVAPPGRSRHRYSTELDLVVSGGVHAWLTRNAGAFGFVQRMSWEPWHWGFLPGCGGGQPGASGASAMAGGLQAWVPAHYRQLVARSARGAGITPAILAAVLKAESDFNPRAVSSAGAQGIAQFMPGTARGMGLDDPFDPVQAIPASARLIASGIREFGSVPLALAAYNAGGGAVRRYRGIPPYPETRAYVAKVMALAGQGGALLGGGGAVVLVRAGDLLA